MDNVLPFTIMLHIIRGYIDMETIAAYNRTNVGDYIEKDYTYDSIGRLENSVVSQYEQGNSVPTDVDTTSWTYDAVGNRKTQTKDSTTETYGYNEFNQLTSITGGANSTTYTYNARGGTATEETGLFKTEYYYDAAGNLNKQAYKENNVVYDEYFHWYDGDGQPGCLGEQQTPQSLRPAV